MVFSLGFQLKLIAFFSGAQLFLSYLTGHLKKWGHVISKLKSFISFKNVDRRVSRLLNCAMFGRVYSQLDCQNRIRNGIVVVVMALSVFLFSWKKKPSLRIAKNKTPPKIEKKSFFLLFSDYFVLSVKPLKNDHLTSKVSMTWVQWLVFL